MPQTTHPCDTTTQRAITWLAIRHLVLGELDDAAFGDLAATAVAKVDTLELTTSQLIVLSAQAKKFGDLFQAIELASEHLFMLALTKEIDFDVFTPPDRPEDR